MNTISINHPVTFTLPANVVTLIDLRDYEFEIPRKHQLAFKVSHDTRFNLDNSYLTSHDGFLSRAGERQALTDGWFEKHVMYMLCEVDSEVTFEVIVNWALIRD